MGKATHGIREHRVTSLILYKVSIWDGAARDAIGSSPRDGEISATVAIRAECSPCGVAGRRQAPPA
jgi:hypothetical protein